MMKFMITVYQALFLPLPFSMRAQEPGDEARVRGYLTHLLLKGELGDIYGRGY